MSSVELRSQPANKEGDENLIHHLILSNDHHAHLLENLLARRVETLNTMLQDCRTLVQSSKRRHRIPFASFRGRLFQLK